MKYGKLTFSLFVVFIVVAVLAGGLVNAAPPAQQQTTFDNVKINGDLTVTDDFTLTDDLAVGGDLAVTGNVTANTDLTVDDTFNIDDTDSTLTGSQTITPTYSYLQVSPTAVLTLTLATGAAVDGDILIIHNAVTTNTVIVDTGATQGGGNVTLAQDDIAAFIFGDSVWVEMFSPDNS